MARHLAQAGCRSYEFTVYMPTSAGCNRPASGCGHRALQVLFRFIRDRPGHFSTTKRPASFFADSFCWRLRHWARVPLSGWARSCHLATVPHVLSECEHQLAVWCRAGRHCCTTPCSSAGCRRVTAMMWHPQLSLALSLAIQAMVTTAPATAASDYSQNDDREADVAMEHWIVPSEAACVVSLALSAVVLALGVALLRLQRQYLARLNQLEAESSSKQNDDCGSRVISNSPPALSQAVVPATSVSYQPYGKGARLTTVQASLNQWTSALDFMTDAQRADVAANVGSIDVTLSLQAAINSGKPLYLPPGTYLVRLLQHIELEGGATVCALIARAGMQLRGSGWESTIIKLKDGESTDRSPQFFNIIASNRAISGLRLSGLRFDINGQNNPISPDRAAGKYNHFNCSMLIVSGSIKMTGADASLSDSRITDCWVENSPGVTCIGTGQSNQPLTALGRNVEIAHCVFHNNGLDTDDHSTLYSTSRHQSEPQSHAPSESLTS